MKHLMVISVFLSFVACGGGSSTASKGKEENPEVIPVCKSADCISASNYILNTRLSNLNKNLRLNLIRKEEGGAESKYPVIDNCKEPGVVKVISNATGSSLFFKLRPMIRIGSTVEIVDLGDDCLGHTVVIKTDISPEAIRAEERTQTINIDLD